MFMRQLIYLVALDRHRHFARAAEHCHVSQPALSTGVSELERELGITIIKRNRSFQGITPEGERVLAWAHQVLASLEGLKQEAALVRDVTGGHLALGTIPSAVSSLSGLMANYRRAFPALTLEACSSSTGELHRRIKKGDLDLAVVYADAEQDESFEFLPLFAERYVLIATDSKDLSLRLGWRDVAGLPLCLFSGEMHNRKILDRIFAEANVRPNIVLQTNSVEIIMSEVRRGALASVLPLGALPGQGMGTGMRIHSIVPEKTSSVGLIRLVRHVQPPLSDAVWKLSKAIDPSVFANDGEAGSG